MTDRPSSRRENRRRVITNQLDRLEASLNRLHHQSARLAQIRLGLFAVGLILSGAAFLWLGGWVAGVIVTFISLAGFSLAVYAHRQIERSILKRQIWRQIKAAQIARMDLNIERIARRIAAEEMVIEKQEAQILKRLKKRKKR